MDLAAAKLAYDALKFAYDLLKDSRLSRKEKRKIESQIDKLVVLAQPSDIDKEVKKAKPGFIPYLTGEAAKKRPVYKKIGAVAKKAASQRRSATKRKK